MCQTMFYNQLPTSDSIHKWTIAPEVGQLDIGAITMEQMCQNTGADTKCSAMEPMCQTMFYNQLPTSDSIHKSTIAPEVGRLDIGAITMEQMCQIMFYNQLPTSDTIYKWTIAQGSDHGRDV